QLLDAGEKADAIVIGPGLGQTPEAEGRLTRLVRLDKPMVVDAGGLNLSAKGTRWPTYFKARAVLTPHPGAMGRPGKRIGRTGEIAGERLGRRSVLARDVIDAVPAAVAEYEKR